MYFVFKHLLDYIYTGETQIPAEDVNRFIEAAQELQIKGLVDELKEPEQTNLLNSVVSQVETIIKLEDDDDKNHLDK